MATVQTLKTYYANVLRVPYAQIPGSAGLDALAADVDTGRTTLAAAEADIARRSIQTTAVGNLSYQFFTGLSLKTSGLDYLINPAGPNPQNLNSAYYQSFNIENRFINFAVNLGKSGEGAQRFAATYGGLSALDTVTRAYAEIFGVTPSVDKATALLNDVVPDGRGGTFTRLDYFATYGLDGTGGIGTKAALVGWLLAQAAKEDVGVYAKAEDAFVADLGPDGLAKFNVDLVASYGPAAAPTPGATITFAQNQSVAPDAADASLRSTANADSITGASGLDAVRSVLGGGGADVISVTGAVAGFIDGGAGNDRITVETLNAPVAVIGGARTGTIAGGDGDDLITVTTRLAVGANVDGGAGDDTLVAAIRETDIAPYDTRIRLTSIEHLVLLSYSNGVPQYNIDLQLDLSAATGLTDVTSQANGTVKLSALADGTVFILKGVSTGTTTLAYQQELIPAGRTTFTQGARNVSIHLDGVRDAGVGGGPTKLVLTGVDGPVQLVADTDSTLTSLIRTPSSSYRTFDPSVVVSGLGRLTIGLGDDTLRLDASAASAVDVTRFGSYQSTTAVLSSGDDRIALDLRTGYNAGVQSVTLGAGSDVVRLYVEPTNGVTYFTNMHVSGATVDGYAQVTDFMKGSDHLDLGATAAGVRQAATGPGATASFADALASVAAGTPANGTSAFEYGGDTWVFHQDATVGANTGDGLIRLVGVTGLTVGAAGSAADIRFG